MRKLRRSKTKKYKLRNARKSYLKRLSNELAVDYMSNTFRPKYSDIIKSINSDIGSTKIRKVINSHYDLYAEISHTKRSKAVRLTENLLNDVKEMLPNDFVMPQIVVVDFEIYDVDAIGGYFRPTNTMYINSKYNTKDKMLMYLNGNDGYFANTTIYAPILHELGHKYYYDTIEKYSVKRNISYNEAEQIIRDKLADYVHECNINGNFLKKNLSKYAQDGYRQGKYSEIVAEAFSAIKSNIVAKEIIQLIGETLL